MPDENNEVTRIESAELLQFIQRRERLAAEKKDIAESEKELNTEIKSAGYDLPWVNHVIKERAKDDDKRAEEQAKREMYEEAAGLG